MAVKQIIDTEKRNANTVALITKYGIEFAKKNFVLAITRNNGIQIQFKNLDVKLQLLQADDELLYRVENGKMNNYSTNQREVQNLHKYLQTLENETTNTLYKVVGTLLNQLNRTAEGVGALYLEVKGHSLIYKLNSRGRILELNLVEKNGYYTYEIVDNNRNKGFYENERTISKFEKYIGLN